MNMEEEEGKESVTEKDQIEEMETSLVNVAENGQKGFDKEDEDELDPELPRIKDDEEKAGEQDKPVPDIAEDLNERKYPTHKPKTNEVPHELPVGKAVVKLAYQHIKTPDEVDDLPEHEVVVLDQETLEEFNSELSNDLEGKIAMDEHEKETEETGEKVDKKEASDGSVEAVRDNESVEVPVDQKKIEALPSGTVNLTDEVSNEVTIEVFDEDFGKDDFLGEAILNLREIVNQQMIVHPWIKLEQVKSGDILFSTEYLPSEEQIGVESEEHEKVDDGKETKEEERPVEETVRKKSIASVHSQKVHSQYQSRRASKAECDIF